MDHKFPINTQVFLKEDVNRCLYESVNVHRLNPHSNVYPARVVEQVQLTKSGAFYNLSPAPSYFSERSQVHEDEILLPGEVQAYAIGEIMNRATIVVKYLTTPAEG